MEVASFAYPYGGATPRVKELVDEAGFRLAVGTQEGHVTSVPDWLDLPRIASSDAVKGELFEMKLSPAWPTYLHIRRALAR